MMGKNLALPAIPSEGGISPAPGNTASSAATVLDTYIELRLYNIQNYE